MKMRRKCLKRKCTKKQKEIVKMKRINKKRKCKNKNSLRRSNIEILVNDPKREKAQNKNRKIVIKKLKQYI